MQIVIDIHEEIYDHIKERFMYGYVNTELDKVGLAVRNGTPLPKGHGRLIDADELRCENADFDTYNDYCLMFDEIDNAPTIIEAERGDSE